MSLPDPASVQLHVFSALQGAYLALLKVPMQHRTSYDLATCRDAIAYATGQDAESVQNRYEALARGEP